MNCHDQEYNLLVNDALVIKEIPFQEKVSSLERIVFRTGPYRGYVPPAVVDGQPDCTGLLSEDLPGADEKAPICIYWIDDVKTRSK